MTGRGTITVLLTIVAAALLAGPPASAQEKSAEVIKKQVYIYDEAGRRDPFISLIRPAAREREKTGIPWLDYDVSQMRLIAVASDKGADYALVGLPDKKYYTIREGMTVGIHRGKVVEILSDAVYIREMKPDYKGRMKPVDTYLRLREEEGQ
jgi:Tfp pilus assembly protein PilP